jgi:hypothetical protein
LKRISKKTQQLQITRYNFVLKMFIGNHRQSNYNYKSRSSNGQSNAVTLAGTLVLS